MQRAVNPLFHDHLPGHSLFHDLVELTLVGDGVVVSDGAVGLKAQVSIQIEVWLRLDMDIGLIRRGHLEAAIEGGEVLPEKGVGFLPGRDAA